MTAHSAAASAAPFNPEPDGWNGPFPTLPGTMQRSQVGDLLRDVRRVLGLSSSALETLLKVIDLTRPSDWIDPIVEPVCYAAQITIAQDLAKTPRQVRTHERALFKLGLIEDRRRANGSRSMHGRCGLVLSPLIARIPDLLAARDRLRAERRETEYLAARRSVLYRRAKELVMELQSQRPHNEDLAAIATDFLAWPASRSLRSMGPAALAKHIEEARKTVARLDGMMRKTADSSGRAEEDFRPPIQATTEETPVSCSADAHQRPAGKPADDHPSEAPPAGGAGRERKSERIGGSRKPLSLGDLTPQRLRSIASPDMQLYIDHETGPTRQPRMLEFVLAAITRLPELGINRSAWDEAVDAMGEDAAMLCVLVIDANRFHPKTPIRRPGGALRAMTRAHARGGLNLVGSLIGLQERLRNEGRTDD